MKRIAIIVGILLITPRLGASQATEKEFYDLLAEQTAEQTEATEAFCFAIHDDSVPSGAIQQLIKANAVNAICQGAPVIHYAQNCAALQTLLDLNANVNGKNYDKKTPLHVQSIKMSEISQVKGIQNITDYALCLLQHNAAVNARDRDGTHHSHAVCFKNM